MRRVVREIGYDAMYAGTTGPDASGATFHQTKAPRGAALPEFDMFTQPALVRAHRRPGRVPHRSPHPGRPTAGLRLHRGPGRLLRPVHSRLGGHLSARVLLRRLLTASHRRTGRLAGRRHWDALLRDVPVHRGLGELRGGRGAVPRRFPDLSDRDRQLAAIESFSRRHHEERRAWRERIGGLADAGGRPVLWGAGSRAVQFLTFADPDRRLAAVVDVNPRKWGRYLPVTAHRVDRPESLAEVRPTAVIITNPAYHSEISDQLTNMGVPAEILVA